MRLFLLTLLTMIAFAANSVFARLGLQPVNAESWIDPASYALIRLGAGAITLVFLVRITATTTWREGSKHGNWLSALGLFAYAAAFSYAYVALDTGMGALILFSCVQATMIGWAIRQGDRPGLLEMLSMATAFGAFLWLVSPGISAPDPVAAGLMAIAGISWGIYSVRGKNAVDPLLATAGNFIRAVPFAVILSGFAFYQYVLHPFGILMAVFSGAVSSAMGYALWYHILKSLKSTQAAIVQLSVPVIAGIGGLVFLNEPVSGRFAICSAFILGGIAMTIWARSKRA